MNDATQDRETPGSQNTPVISATTAGVWKKIGAGDHDHADEEARVRPDTATCAVIGRQDADSAPRPVDFKGSAHSEAEHPHDSGADLTAAECDPMPNEDGRAEPDSSNPESPEPEEQAGCPYGGVDQVLETPEGENHQTGFPHDGRPDSHFGDCEYFEDETPCDGFADLTESTSAPLPCEGIDQALEQPMDEARDAEFALGGQPDLDSGGSVQFEEHDPRDEPSVEATHDGQASGILPNATQPAVAGRGSEAIPAPPQDDPGEAETQVSSNCGVPSRHSEDTEHYEDAALEGIPIRKRQAIDHSDWEAPIDLACAVRPEIPLDLLPEELASWSKAVSNSLQTPPDMAVMAALATVAISAQKHFRVSVNRDWHEQLSAFIVIIAEPSERKSPVFRKAIKAIQEFECAENQRRGPLIRKYEEEADEADAELKAAKKALKGKLSENERESAQARIEAARSRIESLTPVKNLRMYADDTTTEALEKSLIEQNGRFAVMSSEGGLFQLLGGRYAEAGKGGNIDVYLKGISGDPHRVDRIGRTGGQIKCTTLSVLLFVQPGAMHDAANNRSFMERGLFARIWLVTPTSMVGRRRSDPEEVPPEIASAWDHLVNRLLQMTPDIDEFGEIRPRDLSLSPEATSHRLALQDALEPRLGPGGDLSAPEIASWAGKLIGSTVRIAAILHLIDVAARSAQSLHSVLQFEATEIPKHWMEVAGKIAFDYLLPHAQYAMQAMQISPAHRLAGHILAYLRREGCSAISGRDLRQGIRSHAHTKEQFAEALTLLEDHHAIKSQAQERPAGKPGRKPSPLILVNPAISARPAQGASSQEDRYAQAPLKMLGTLTTEAGAPPEVQNCDQSTRTAPSGIAHRVQASPSTTTGDQEIGSLDPDDVAQPIGQPAETFA